MQWFVILLVGLLFTLTGCSQLGLGYKYYFQPCAEDGPNPTSDFEIVSPEFDLAAFYKQIETFQDSYQIEQLAQVEYEGEAFPIYRASLARVAASDNGSSKNRLLVVGGIHGDESASLLAIVDMLETYRSQLADKSHWEVVFVLPSNPVGLKYNSRYNGDGCDINRDFFSLNSIEAKTIEKEILRFDPDLVLSLHEGPQEGFFIIATKPSDEQLAKTAISHLQESGIELSEKSFLGLRLADNGLWIEGGFVTWFKKVAGIGSLGAYMTERDKAVFTSESSWFDKDISARVRSHVVFFESIVQTKLDVQKK